jgi:solute carrier family 25 protein 16
MPPALMSHASMPGVSPSQQLREATDVRRAAVASTKEPGVCPTDDEAQVPRKVSQNKRNLDYVWRSGVAGGFAGCAVGGSLLIGLSGQSRGY